MSVSELSGGGAPRVSIIIAARNNARYLDEAIRSAFLQTHPCEIIYADDASSDDSLEIARSWEPAGLIVLPGYVHRGVCAARNRGAAAARGEFLVHLDGDDRLTPDFVARHLAAMSPGTPFVYGPARAFGAGRNAGAFWPAAEWSNYDRWKCNTVNTSAMYARWAFAAAGRWSDRVVTMWDWDLALRASRLGTPRVSTAILDYRQHAESWSASIQEKESQRNGYLAEVRRRNARLAVGSILSGRLPGLLPRWLDALALAVRQLDLSEPPSLVLLLHGSDSDARLRIERALAMHADTFGSLRTIPYPVTFSWQGERERRDQVAKFLADAYRRLAAEMRGDLHWFVEDDVLVPIDGGRLLWQAVTEGETPPEGISGCYRNRHVPDRYVGGWWRGDHPEELHSLPSDRREPIPVDFLGTGCLMTWPSRTPEWTDSQVRGIPAHDWAWCAQVLARRGRLFLHPLVRCRHAVDEQTLIPG